MSSGKLKNRCPSPTCHAQECEARSAVSAQDNLGRGRGGGGRGGHGGPTRQSREQRAIPEIPDRRRHANDLAPNLPCIGTYAMTHADPMARHNMSKGVKWLSAVLLCDVVCCGVVCCKRLRVDKQPRAGRGKCADWRDFPRTKENMWAAQAAGPVHMCQGVRVRAGVRVAVHEAGGGDGRKQARKSGRAAADTLAHL